MTFDTDDPDWNEIIREASKRGGYADYWEWRTDRTLAEEHAARVLVHFLTKRDGVACLHHGNLTRPMWC
jgi:hypothetical protein